MEWEGRASAPTWASSSLLFISIKLLVTNDKVQKSAMNKSRMHLHLESFTEKLKTGETDIIMYIYI